MRLRPPIHGTSTSCSRRGWDACCATWNFGTRRASARCARERPNGPAQLAPGYLALHRPGPTVPIGVQRVSLSATSPWRELSPGAEHLASHGVVPIPTVCTATGRPTREMRHTRLGVLLKTEEGDGRDLPEVCGRAVWRHRLPGRPNISRDISGIIVRRSSSPLETRRARQGAGRSPDWLFLAHLT